MSSDGNQAPRRIRVLEMRRGSPDGVTVHRYLAGETYGPETQPPMPADLAETFLREGWGEAIKDAANRKRSAAAKKQPRTEDGRRLSGGPTTIGATCDSHSDIGREAKAAASRVHAHEASVEPTPDAACVWCHAAYARRATGGTAQRFCSAACRQGHCQSKLA